MWKLKPNVPDFTVVDGPFANRSYRAGESYAEVPPGEEAKFEEARQEAQATEAPRRGRWNASPKEDAQKEEGEGGKDE